MEALKKLVRTLYRTAIITLVGFACLGAAYIADCLPKAVELREKVVHVPEPDLSVDELIEEIAPGYGIKPIVLRAIVERESGGKKNAIRFEPGQMARAAKLTSNAEQQRMLASSHGVAQIMGWWSPHFNIEWSDLYDARTNLEIACAILKKGLDRRRGLPRAAALRGALEEYNGSKAYADAIMRQLGDALIERDL